MAGNNILVIDNYDSFTWNLVHYLMELGAEVNVVRNDALTAEDAIASGAKAFLISPGPCTPHEAGPSLDLVGATRYHSLVVEDIPDCLIINARSDDGHVMGFRHESLPIHSVQFHPESIATEHGHAMLANFLKIAGIPVPQPA